MGPDPICQNIPIKCKFTLYSKWPNGPKHLKKEHDKIQKILKRLKIVKIKRFVMS